MAEEDDKRKREEWNNWLHIRNIHIDSVQRVVHELNSELDKLRRKDEEDREVIANANSLWNKLNPWGRPSLTKDELDKLEADRIQRLAAKRVKEANLSGFKAQLDELEREKKAKAAREQFRHTTFRNEKIRRENERRQKEYQEQQRREEEKQRRERERLEKERREHLEKLRQERERRDREKREQEKEHRERERRRKEEEQRQQRKWREMQQERSRKDAEDYFRGSMPSYWNRSQTLNTDASPSPKSCRHKIYWDKILGQNLCPHCQKLQYRFLYQCPICSTMGCARCMNAMKNGTRLDNKSNATFYYEE